MAFTIDPDGIVAGQTGHIKYHDDLADVLNGLAGGSYGGVLNVRNTAYAGGAAGNGVTDDTAAIQAALNAATYGQIVFLPQGTYVTSSPLTVPPGVTLQGASGNVFSLSDRSAVIKPSALWSQGTAPAKAVILLLSQSAGSYSVTSEEQRLLSFTVDGSNLVSASISATAGIQVYGNVGSVLVRDVNIMFTTGVGFYGTADSGSHSPSGVWEVDHLVVHRAGTNGVNFTATDSTWRNCYIIGAGQLADSDGWVMGTSSNSQFIACRVEDSIGGSGFHYTAQNAFGNGVNFVGCSTQGNDQHGFYIQQQANSGAGPVSLTGCRANDDGTNKGAGGGGYASFFVTNIANTVTLAGCLSVPGNAQSTTSPQYGLSVTSGNGSFARCTVTSSLLWGITAPINSDNTMLLRVDPSCVLYTGGNAAPTVTGAGLVTVTAGYTVNYQDTNVFCNAGSAITVNLRNPPNAGRKVTVKDTSGSASANHITVQTPGGVNIDGAANVTISSNYGAVSAIADGTNWWTV